MSLYSLDILIDKDGKYNICEINGVRSGMKGFLSIYGDNRTEEKVYRLLQDKYGEITVNTGVYSINKFKREHPLLFTSFYLKSRMPLLRRLFLRNPKILLSKKAEIGWMSEEVPNSKKFEPPFEVYKGQNSTVLNLLNEKDLPHQLINPYVSEEISRNKFLQYLVLKDSEIKDNILRSALVGLGATDERTLEEILEESSTFVIKPILGACGVGFKILSKEEARRYVGTRGAIDGPSIFDTLFVKLERKDTFSIIEGKKSSENYIDNLISIDDFSFEPGLAMIQPFIDTKGNINGDEFYSSVRAIVCNGQFIDSYLRTSKYPKVNFSQDAHAHPFEEEGLGSFCEKSINIFEEKCSGYDPETFKRDLYSSYIKEIGDLDFSEVHDRLMKFVGMLSHMQR